MGNDLTAQGWWLLVAVGVLGTSLGCSDTNSTASAESKTASERQELQCEQLRVGAACAEELCKKNDCGGAKSVLDENSCYRKTCETDADCDDTTRCQDVSYAPIACSEPEGDNGTCTCGSFLMFIDARMCMPK